MVLLHVGAKDEYAAKHIPGARLIAFDDISLPMDQGSNPTLADARASVTGSGRCV